MKHRIIPAFLSFDSADILVCVIVGLLFFLQNSSAQDSTTTDIYRGPKPAAKEITLSDDVFTLLSTSGAKSEYFTGLRRKDDSKGAEAVHVKIMRILGRTSANGDFAQAEMTANTRLVAVVLDSSGNYLPNLHIQKGAEFQLGTECLKLTNSADNIKSSAFSSKMFVQNIVEQSLYNSTNLSVALCTDKAGYMQRFGAQADVAYQAFFSSFGKDVEKIRVQYDHRIATDSLTMKGNTTPERGLTALYKAAYKAASLLKYSEKSQKVLVVVTGGADDASIIYTLRDVLDVVQESGITVYAVALGSGADTYALRTMAHGSGGRFYAVDESASGNIARELIAVLQEIANSYKVFYEIMPAVKSASNGASNRSSEGENRDVKASPCMESDVALTLTTPDKRLLRESTPYLVPSDTHFPKHQIIATFAPLSAAIPEEFEGQIATLGETLGDNPTKVIELIGHTDQTGNDANNRNFALRRAQAVKRYLVQMGVNPAQIRLRSVGREKPMFYFENEDWKARANRRVELRWLDPSLVPYEILAQAVSSEEEAMRLEAEWNTRGYEAYYEAFLINRIPAFRLKLWGFPTLESAEKVKRELQEKYKLRLTVQ